MKEVTEWFEEYRGMGIGYTEQHRLWNNLKIAQSVGNASWRRVGEQISEMIFEDAEKKRGHCWMMLSNCEVFIDWQELVHVIRDLENQIE